MNPAPVVGAPGARTVPQCQTGACPGSGNGRCATCPYQGTDGQAGPGYPPSMPSPMPAPQPFPMQPQPYCPPAQYPQPQSYYPQQQPPFYPQPQPANMLQPVMDKVNADGVSWWMRAVTWGPVFVLLFIVYFWAIEWLGGRWDPFGQRKTNVPVMANNAPNYTPPNYTPPTYSTTTTQYQSQSGVNTLGGLANSVNAIAINAAPAGFGDGNYPYMLDHAGKRVIIGLITLTIDHRMAIQGYEAQGYHIEYYPRPNVQPGSSGPTLISGAPGSLKQLLVEIKQLSSDMRKAWDDTYASRFFNEERTDLERRLNDLNSKVDQALGLATQELR